MFAFFTVHDGQFGGCHYIFSIFISFIVRLKVSVISITATFYRKKFTEWSQKPGPRERTTHKPIGPISRSVVVTLVISLRHHNAIPPDSVHFEHNTASQRDGRNITPGGLNLLGGKGRASISLIWQTKNKWPTLESTSQATYHKHKKRVCADQGLF
jgi:hypothetical protein